MKNKGKWNPRENKNHKLLTHVDERIDTIHQSLRTLYFGEQDHTRAGVIHGIREQVCYLRDVLFDLLFDEMPAVKILENKK